MIANEFNNTDLLMLVTIFLLLILLIFTSVAEMGLSRMSRPRAGSLADKGLKSGKALKRLVDHPERWVNPLLLTVNIAQTVQATLTGIFSARMFGTWGVVVGVGRCVGVVPVLAHAASPPNMSSCPSGTALGLSTRSTLALRPGSLHRHSARRR